MPLSTVVAGAAPVWVGDRLNGSPHRGNVLHVGTNAIYFCSGDDVIGVVSRYAVPVPCTITTLFDTVDDLFDSSARPVPGDPVEIGSGVVNFGPVQVRVGRYTSFALPPFDRRAASRMRDSLNAADVPTSPDEIAPAILGALRNAPADPLEQVLGRGSGLTPFGDDVVCGMLATLLACGAPCADMLRTRTLELAPTRTTALSATLLSRAAQGDVLPAFARVVATLLDRTGLDHSELDHTGLAHTGLAHSGPDQPDQVSASIADLLRVGHTSGAGMLLGLSLALDHIHTRSCCS